MVIVIEIPGNENEIEMKRNLNVEVQLNILFY